MNHCGRITSSRSEHAAGLDAARCLSEIGPGLTPLLGGAADRQDKCGCDDPSGQRFQRPTPAARIAVGHPDMAARWQLSGLQTQDMAL